MPPPWSMPLDVDRLSRGGAEVDFDIPLAVLPRVASRLAGQSGSARGKARFGRQSGTAVVDLALEGTATLQCQRCLQPMEWPVRSSARVALLAAEAEAGALAEELEPMLAPDGRIRMADLVEEELLLALPIVALHAGGWCAAPLLERSMSEEAGKPATQLPFARLGELLSHK